MSDITPVLLRQGLRETMSDTGKSLDDIAPDLGFNVITLRVWLNRVQTAVPRLEEAVGRFLAAIEDQSRKASGMKMCSRCKSLRRSDQMYANGYCRPCMSEYAKQRYQAKKASAR